MMLSKGECENCVGVFTDKICLSCPNEHCSVNCEVHKSENQIYEFIDEHFELAEKIKWLKEEMTEPAFNLIFSTHEFIHNWYQGIQILSEENAILQRQLSDFENPQPYKLKDLKPGMWVWDSKIEKCNKILEINNDKIGFYYVTDNLTRFTCKFEENRFYPVQMANVEGFL